MNINVLRLYNVLYFVLFSSSWLSAEDEGQVLLKNSENTTRNFSEIINQVKGDKGTSVEGINQRLNTVDFSTHLVEETASLNGINIESPAVTLSLQDVASVELQQRANLSPPSHEILTQTTEQLSDLNLTNTDKKTELNEPVLDLQSAKDKDKENITEEIPSFSEWTQKRLEAEKSKEIANTSNTNITSKSGTKLRWKNYASLDCGAKVVASNPEAVSPSAILSPSKDEYKLNPCTSRIWFIVELCEAIQAKKIDLANFELFSSSPKDFSVSVSDRFPTREWSNVGQFTGNDERNVQSFDLHPQLFGKYIKVEIKSHFGSEHYCPISLFRVYGTSEFEVLQKEDAIHLIEDDDDSDDEDLDLDSEEGKNLFNSATNVVISMVKKVGAALSKSDSENSTAISETAKTAEIDACVTPSHLVVCVNCTDELYEKVYELLSCHYEKIWNLISIPFISETLAKSTVCKDFGFNFNEINKQSDYLEALINRPFLGALCNCLAIIKNKVVLNISVPLFPNQTETEIIDENNILNNVTIETNDFENLPEIESSENQVLTTSDFTQIQPTTTENFESTTSILPTITNEPPTATTNEINELNSSEIYDQPDYLVVDNNLEETLTDLNDTIITPSNSQTTTTTTPTSGQQQKESVFLRLSNRIKNLERNLSLSSQYLEELSKRYKKQIEEIQKLERILTKMTEDTKRNDEKNKRIEEKLEKLEKIVDKLSTENDSYSLYLVVTIILTIIVFSYCCRIDRDLQQQVSDSIPERRKSIDVVENCKPKKKRRPSDQALKIVHLSAMIAEERRKKKKKKINLQRSNSITLYTQTGDWVEETKKIDEIPIALDESEHSSLEPFSAESLQVPDFIKTASDSRIERNGKTISHKNDDILNIDGRSDDSDNNTPKKERKGLKRIFKKVF